MHTFILKHCCSTVCNESLMIFGYFAIYSVLLCESYASFGYGGQILSVLSDIAIIIKAYSGDENVYEQNIH